jgi:DNA-binding response OmpR family regulator
MPPLPKVFLVVDDNADSRFLLAKTLARKFPDAIIRECQESEQALEIVAREPMLTAIVAHRAADIDGISLIRTLRAANPDVIILMVSGLDRTHTAIRAGATCFLNYDEWLCVGSLMTDLLARAQAAHTKVENESSGSRNNNIPRNDHSRPGVSQMSPLSNSDDVA